MVFKIWNETVRSFGESIYAGKIRNEEAVMDQTNLLENMINFNNKSRPGTKEDKDKKQDAFGRISALYEGPELTLNTFRSAIFPIKDKQGEGLKILTPKQMLQKLPKASAQVKAGYPSETLLNEIR